MANRLQAYDVHAVFHDGHELRFIENTAGERFFVAISLAGAAGYKAVRDVAGRHVPEDHRFLVSSPDAERISGLYFRNTAKTKTLTLVDLAGAELIVTRSRSCTAQRAEALLTLCRESAAGTIQPPANTNKSEGPTLFDEPSPAGGTALDVPGPGDENLILSQAVKIAEKRLAAAKVKHYPPGHLFNATELGEPFGVKAVSLNKILEKERIQFPVRHEDRQLWVLTPEYRDRNLAFPRDVEKNGRLVRCLLWTWKGKQLVEEVLKRAGFVKKD